MAIQTVLNKLKITEDQLKCMYRNRKTTGDVSFKIGPAVVKAHKAVLAALSLKYERQFSGNWKDESIIDIADVSPQSFETFIEFFYLSSSSDRLNHSNIDEVLLMATMNASDEVIKECVNFMINNDNGRVCEWFYWAQTYCLDELKTHCENKFIERFQLINDANEIESCSNEMLSKILDLELMCAEIDVFETCMDWAKVKSDNATDMNTLRNTLGPCLNKIRFCSLTNEQFVDVLKKYRNLITTQEAVDIIIEISKGAVPGDAQTLPKGYYVVNKIHNKRSMNGIVSKRWSF